jgi:hypothetical protein
MAFDLALEQRHSELLGSISFRKLSHMPEAGWLVL